MKNINNINKYLFVLFGICIPVSTGSINVLLGFIFIFLILDNIKCWFEDFF